ncbi:MAG TPA: hypothetical protein VG737_09260, partial [Cyclobacteriaceae bacterium]|nr:hypothetical protein [Cyclobacteriaceae bacterium]
HLYEKKFEAENDLSLIDSIQVIEGLTPYGKPVWPKLTIVLIISFIVGFLLSFLAVSVKIARKQQRASVA